MGRMGMSVDEVSNVDQVIIKTSQSEIIIDRPEVTLTRIQGQDIYQVIGGEVVEEKLTSKKPDILEEDVRLVAQQANVDLETAKKALRESQGDLAKAILLLAQK
jgi:nascent polypeptide-associated complex subunit alpha